MAPDHTPEFEPVDYFNLAARRKPGTPADFVWCKLEVLNDGQDLLTGCAQPTATYKSGKRKGRPKWPPEAELRRVVVSRAEVTAERTRWETETGRCSGCYGNKKTIASSTSLPEGGVARTYRTCPRCKGSGTKPETPAPCSAD